MIVISGEMIERKNRSLESKTVYFSRWDNGDVYSLIKKGFPQKAVPGTIYWTAKKEKISVNDDFLTEFSFLYVQSASGLMFDNFIVEEEVKVIKSDEDGITLTLGPVLAFLGTIAVIKRMKRKA